MSNADRPIPVVLESEKHKLPERAAKIVVPDERTDLLEILRPKRFCIECRHFSLRKGQLEIKEQEVFEQLFDKLAFNHDPAWYGRTDLFGLCRACDGLMVHAYAGARIPRDRVDPGASYEDKDKTVECPHYDPRGKRSHPSQWLNSGEDI